MAFALKSFKAYGRYIDEPITTRCHQVVVMEYTRGATGDTDADISDFTADSTFWANATGDATYGTLAVTARSILQKIMNKAEILEAHSLKSNTALMLRAASATANTNYALADAGTYPAVLLNITHYADAAPATVKAVFEFVNKTEERAERYGV